MKERFTVGAEMDAFGIVGAEREDGDRRVVVKEDEVLPANTIVYLDPERQRSAFNAHVRAGDLVKAPAIGNRNAE